MTSLLISLAHGDRGAIPWAASAPLIAGLVAGAIHVLTGPDHLAAVAYVLAYGVGSIASMAGFAHALGLVMGEFAGGGQKAIRRMLGATGLAAMGVGAWWIIWA